jgi:hypothetical protein
MLHNITSKTQDNLILITMKSNIKILAILLALVTSAVIFPKQASAQQTYVSFQVFYDELSPYGTWVYTYDYGYVWLPDVAPGFTPYATNGYWVFTDDGWTWVSDYSWGWAPFHYGRWYTDPNYGPMWVPDNQWGPGWVTWRRSGDYYGWAPIGPGVSINVAYSRDYNVPYNQWTFVRDRDFGRTNINNYYINSSNNVTIINNSTVINNTRVNKTQNVTYNAGPDRAEVEHRAGRTITPVAIKESNKPGQNLSNNQLQIYRPQVQKNISTGQKPAPSKIANLKDVKQPSERNATNQPQRSNPSEKEEGVKQQQAQPPQQTNPSKKEEGVMQQQQAQPPQQANPSKNVKEGKQPQHTGKPAKHKNSQPKQNSEPPH